LEFALANAGHNELLAAAYPELGLDTVRSILEAGGAFAEGVISPLNRVGDTHGATYANGKVTAAPGFREAYKSFVDGGWSSLSSDPEFGGQGLSKALDFAVFEMMSAASMAFGLCPLLTQGAIEALSSHGTEFQKTVILPKLVSGEWTATMNLTEPQAGSDLAAVTTRAVPDGAGGYRLTGEKIFITWGDHDLTDNICHLVLARTPDAPAGVKGISLFLASKHLINPDGSLGPRNDLRPASIEHKLGIHGSPTCVMLFEGAQAELVGTLNNGLAHMFVMMNAARLGVGVQGIAIAERAYQQALAYALERKQGAASLATDGAGTIWDHPDVRRTLLLMKAKIDAGRALYMNAGVLFDMARLSACPETREAARSRQELLTPIVKSWGSDLGVEVASHAVQMHGGMGYVEETGVAQHLRDARIAPIYEGTNAIQAIDLVRRKLRADDGAAMRSLCADIRATADDLVNNPGLASVGLRLRRAVDALEGATNWIVGRSSVESLAAASPFLKLAGDVAGGWLLAQQALAAGTGETSWLRSKPAIARLYASQVLACAPGAAEGLIESHIDLQAVSADAIAA
jgi:alkylation response protein AidB-like acyl-CoA dehydrogenase